MKNRILKNLIVFLFLAYNSGSVFAQQEILSLRSSNDKIIWKVKSQDEVDKNTLTMMSPNYDTSGWVEAVVPGTVFGSYVEAGLEEDPNFGDNAYKVDKAKYDKNYWYRAEFSSPSISNKELVWLNFEGVNRKGEVYLNGHRLGLLDGFMNRGLYDITNLLRTDEKNILSVLIHWVGVPVPNHASPTYIASASWDWMPYVPGLLSGITDDVYLTKTKEVSIIDPWLRTKVPTLDEARLKLQLEVKNNTWKEQNVVLKGVIQPSNIQFEKTIKIEADKQKTFHFTEKEIEQFIVKNPRLWWPNGYGEPHLYECKLTLSVDGEISDSKDFKFGIREFDYELVDEVFRIKVNGEPIYIKGGNWGMSEYMLRCRGEEYDLKLKLHHEMHYNMVRNWIGSVTDEEFYEACDKYGIMIWDDFWLNSHKNLPNDVQAFNNNAIEKIKRLRNHASIAVWCGENEGYPLAPLNDWLAGNVKYFDGGDRWYQANSNSDGLSGSGPWANYHPAWYFTKYPMPYGHNSKRGWGLRTEIGTAVFTTFDSFKEFMPKESWWPRNDMWDKHFFGKSAANADSDKYFKTVEKNYGKATGIEDFCRKAQLVNLESNKAMYEGWQHQMWDDASGIMTWMSQSAYPSLVWQTYDYYYDLTGAYWGVKKACEPLHVQWSYADNSVKVINTTRDTMSDLNVSATLYNMDGQLMSKYSQESTVKAGSNQATHCFDINFSTDNLAYKKQAYTSSTSNDAGEANSSFDGSDVSRWASEYSDNQWIYVDLGQAEEIRTIVLKWENAHAKEYKLLVSDDASTWKEVYTNAKSKGGVEEIKLKPTSARYVKMQGVKRSSDWGYSLYEMEVYGRTRTKTDLSPVHFIKLTLSDATGSLLSENLYWRANEVDNYQALNKLPKSKLKVDSKLVERDGKKVIQANIKNIGLSVAFAIHVQAKNAKDGKRILPAIMNENYFTLLQNESKDIEIEFDAKLLGKSDYKLDVIPYNK